MIASDVETAIDELQELVGAARVIAPFTGAGISTECGIPDFRSPGGLWTKNHPIPFEEHVIELHGNTSYALCLDCGKRYELAWVREKFIAARERAPDCADCGGHIKTATVSFGQAMPEREMRRAEQLTLDCDLFLAVGSSLVVWPAAGFPLLAKRNGARLAIINREATEFDEIADLVVREDIGTVLSPFIVH